ncbi:MAG: ATP-binding protein [Polyangiales bacterium]
MRYPAFLAEMALPSRRPQLEFSVRSGLVLVSLFAALAVVGLYLELVPFGYVYFLPVLLKLGTNTLAWLSLRKNVLVLEAAALNVLADCIALTWAIYLTGGPLSPLFAIYTIELTVVALLSNLRVTILVASTVFVLYASMLSAVSLGILPPLSPPAIDHGQVTSGYVFMLLVLGLFVLAIPTFFTAAILRELREKQIALEQKTRALVEASKEKSLFMANVTHELRTPIHGICGLSDLVASGIYGEVSEKQKRAQAEIKRSAQSLLALVDDILALSRAEAGKLVLERGAVDLDELLERIVASGRGVIGTRDLVLDLVAERDLPIVETDRGKLVQILMNLVSNAIKFTADGGKITIRAKREGSTHVRFEVEDTGEGIPDGDLERIFEPFRQVDGSAEREHGGVGLGLALVKRLAEVLGARVDVRSTLGVGSCFGVSLPVRKPTSRPPSTPPWLPNEL